MNSDSHDSQDSVLVNQTTLSDDPGLVSFSTESSPVQESHSLDMKYFWIINSIVLVCAIMLLLFCCRKRGAELIERWTHVSGRNSDYVYAARVARRLEEEREKKKENPEERKSRLIKCFKDNGVVMFVEEASYESNSPTDEESGGSETDSTDSNDNNNDIESVGSNMQTVAIPTDAKNGNRTVPNCCAICLCPYDLGDEIVWSSNEKCSHAFHSECIVDWLIKMQEGTPCPCCRQDFTDLPERVVKKDFRTFDLGTVSV